MQAGAAVVDITPRAGLQLSGFAARTQPATGAHDRLSARAIVVDDTALVVVDVLGVTAATSARIRARCELPAANVVVAALHTHGAPDAMPGRVGIDVDGDFLQQLEDGCVRALDTALTGLQACRLEHGSAAGPGIATNRRHADGPVDDVVPVLQFIALDGEAVIATLVGYACHPVVLGADNSEYTADYPAAVRRTIENAHPGCVAVFVTGACADANSGHSARASMTLQSTPARTFTAADRIGERIAGCALQAPLSRSASGRTSIASETVPVMLQRREPAPLSALVDTWRARHAGADAAERALLGLWIRWADEIALDDDVVAPAAGPTCRTTLLRWGDTTLVALPGEIFATTAQELRHRLREPHALVIAYAEDNPGYFVPPGELPKGGYEVEEAHRYYRQGGAFSDDSVERLLASVDRLAVVAQQGLR